jgi:hypothetical protein
MHSAYEVERRELTLASFSFQPALHRADALGGA